MALIPYMTKTYTGPSLQGVYQTALSRWLAGQKGFKEAEEPLLEAKGLLSPGGGYGEAQRLEIDEAARKAKAEAMANLVATGMSSGSNAAGLQARIGADVGKAKAGIEQSRMDALMQLLSQMSGLKAAAAGQAGTVDPALTSMISGIFGLESSGQLGTTYQPTGTAQTNQTDIPKLHL